MIDQGGSRHARLFGMMKTLFHTSLPRASSVRTRARCGRKIRRSQLPRDRGHLRRGGPRVGVFGSARAHEKPNAFASAPKPASTAAPPLSTRPDPIRPPARPRRRGAWRSSCTPGAGARGRFSLSSAACEPFRFSSSLSNATRECTRCAGDGTHAAPPRGLRRRAAEGRASGCALLGGGHELRDLVALARGSLALKLVR